MGMEMIEFTEKQRTKKIARREGYANKINKIEDIAMERSKAEQEEQVMQLQRLSGPGGPMAVQWQIKYSRSA